MNTVLAHPYLKDLDALELVARTGRVRKILPTYLEADGPNVARGTLCSIEGESSQNGLMDSILAEVVSVDRDSIRLTPFNDRSSIVAGARVTACQNANTAPVGDAFCGRVVDALARPIDGRGSIKSDMHASLIGAPTTPLDRAASNAVLETGIRSIDGLLTMGKGQRVGLFAASGVGKTTLVTQLANQVGADRCVICLVGERGREVESLWSQDLAPEAKRRTTLVVATSDEAASMRVRACDYALTLADYWRRRGDHVLLLLDSVTRLAMAMREIGLAAGEPPTLRAYTPSVFSAIPKLVEQCGILKSGGSITAIMTVLSETDDVDDPISEMMKSLLDGHIILSRELAEQSHFPAINVTRSISRLASRLMSKAHKADADKITGLLSTYESARTLIETGIYAKGANPAIDRALEARPALMRFLQQRSVERVPFEAVRSALAEIANSGA